MKVISSMIANMMHHIHVHGMKGAMMSPLRKTGDSHEPEATGMPKTPHGERLSTAGEAVRSVQEEE